MNKVTVLVEGYARVGKQGEYVATPTTVLIESNGIKFVFDPGTNEERLRTSLKKNNVSEKDLSFVYLSHWHPDHFLNIRLFPKLPVYDGEICWKDHKEIFHQGKLPGVKDVEILKTPGHSPEHTSLLVKTPKGNICIAADVFWWKNGTQRTDRREKLLSLNDPFAPDKKSLLKSRELVLSKADFIIPGHGKIFKNDFKK